MPSTAPTLPGITSHMVTTPRLTTRVLTSGASDGAPVIFVHGNATTATFWEETMLALPAGFRGIAYDLRGFGDADEDKKVDSTQGLGDLAADLQALMDTLGIAAAHLIGHSAGGSVLWRFMMDFPASCQTVTVVDPGSPYGFGGTRGLGGTPNTPDFAGSGGGTINAAFPPSLQQRDASDAQGSPRWTLNTFYFKPPFRSAREEDLLASMWDTHVGPEDYPGDMTPSANWPMIAPGTKGLINALTPKYAKSPEHLLTINPKPPVLWIRGSHDQIISDTSFFDACTLGKLGVIPGWPGEEVAPSQPMVGQTRAVLEKYAAAGGSFTEVVIEDTGHTPFLEKPEEFNAAFFSFLQG